MTDQNKTERLVRKIRESIAMDQWQSLGRKKELEAMGLAPELYPRKGKRGQPLKYAMQPSLIENGCDIPIYRDEDIWQLFCKQKWQAGKPVSNSRGKHTNQCACAVADSMGVNVSQIWKRIDRVPKERRKEVELWLLKLLFDEGQVHPKKLKKAIIKLGMDE
jgi:hypothetical protein